MRHKAQVSNFGRGADAKKALFRGLVVSLVEHGRIKTTVAKAKELRRHAERAVTMAKKGTLHARRLLLSRYPHTEAVKNLVDNIAPRFKTRPGGYTRIVKLGQRVGDGAEMAFIEWVDYVLPTVDSKEKATAKKAAPAKKAPAKKTAEPKEKKAPKKATKA